MKGFREINVEAPYAGDKKILVLSTSARLLQMADGKYFSTGHNSTECFVPLYHFDKCGFKFEFATEEGKAVQIEEWTFPLATGYEDKLREIQGKLKSQTMSPLKYDDVDLTLEKYAAVFIPGGHGPLINMMTNKSLGTIVRSTKNIGLPMMSLCHGPAALVSSSVGGDFAYKGYKLCVFPDKTDAQSPSFGYLPGKLPEQKKAEAALTALGAQVQNKEMDDSVCTDRELVTGASQQSAQNMAEAAIKLLANKYQFKAS